MDANRQRPWRLRCAALASLVSAFVLPAFVLPSQCAPHTTKSPRQDARVTMYIVTPGGLLQGSRAKTKRGPPKYHMPTGGPNVTKTSDLMELRVSYTVDTSNVVAGERQVLNKLQSDEVAERRNASEALLKFKWTGRPQRQTLLKLLHAVLDDDMVVRINVASVLKLLCEEYRWEMDEWIAKLSMKIAPDSDEDIVTKIYTMKAFGILGPYASSYSVYLMPFFDHEEEYVRMVAVETVGQLTLEVPRHKRSLVRLLREDPSQEVRKLCDRVLKQRGWQEPKWMKIQHPAWRDRVIRANANRGKGTTKGKRSEGKFGKIYWEVIKQKRK